MKKQLLIILLSIIGLSGFSQTYSTLPTGSTPYGNQFYKTPDGLIIAGTGSAKFRVIGTKAYVDSLLALKVNVSQLTQYQLKSEKGIADGYASLNSAGKIPNSQIPALAISETFTVSSQAAQTALTAEQGDVAIRTDLSKSFILRQVPASNFGNWSELLTPLSAVQSVNGQTGVVTLAKSDIGLGDVDNTSDLNKPISNAAQTALNSKANLAGGNTFTGGQVIDGGLTIGTGSSSTVISSTGLTGINPVAGGGFGLNNSGFTVYDGLGNLTSIIPNAISYKKNSNTYSLNFPAENGELAVKENLAAGKTIGANTTGSAVQWNGATNKFNNGIVGGGLRAFTGTDSANDHYRFSIAAAKSALAITLQDVTNNGNRSISPISIESESNATPVLGVSDYKLYLNDGGVYGTQFGVLSNGAGFLQQGRTDGPLAYNYLINPSGGYVGIGTQTPTSKLEVNGGAIKANNNQIGIATNLVLENSTTSGGQDGTSIEFKGFYKQAKISTTSNPTQELGGDLKLQTYSNRASNDLNDGITITKSGYVGINKNTPNYPLDVDGSVSALAFLGPLIGNATTATNVAWSGVTNKPTSLSQFTNDIGIEEPIGSTLVKRNSDGFVYATYLNQSSSIESSDNVETLYGGVGNDGFLRKLTSASVKKFLNYNLATVTNSGNYTYKGINFSNGTSNYTLKTDSSSGDLEIKLNGTIKARVTPDGIQAVNLTSGTYTPTLTIISGLTSTSPITGSFKYTRVGDMVTVYGSVSITSATQNSNKNISVSLPIASNLTVDGDLIGVGSATTTEYSPTVVASAINESDTALLTVGNHPGGTYVVNITFMYQVK